MRPSKPRSASLLLLPLLAVAGCATRPAVPEPPAGATATTRTEANGDVVTEYRVSGQLRMVRVQPRRGPAWYLVDRDGDGRPDESQGEGPVSPVYYRLFTW
jgi:hypothetical protein